MINFVFNNIIIDYVIILSFDDSNNNVRENKINRY